MRILMILLTAFLLSACGTTPVPIEDKAPTEQPVEQPIEQPIPDAEPEPSEPEPEPPVEEEPVTEEPTTEPPEDEPEMLSYTFVVDVVDGETMPYIVYFDLNRYGDYFVGDQLFTIEVPATSLDEGEIPTVSLYPEDNNYTYYDRVPVTEIDSIEVDFFRIPQADPYNLSFFIDANGYMWIRFYFDTPPDRDMNVMFSGICEANDGGTSVGLIDYRFGRGADLKAGDTHYNVKSTNNPPDQNVSGASCRLGVTHTDGYIGSR